MTGIGSNPGFILSAETIVGQNPEKFGLANFTYDMNFIRNDFSFGKPHMLTRQKAFDILLIEVQPDSTIKIWDRPNLRKLYNIKYDDPSVFNKIDYNDTELKILNTNLNVFADSLIKEPFTLFEILWRARRRI